jgi:hypothetical protein
MAAMRCFTLDMRISTVPKPENSADPRTAQVLHIAGACTDYGCDLCMRLIVNPSGEVWEIL